MKKTEDKPAAVLVTGASIIALSLALSIVNIVDKIPLGAFHETSSGCKLQLLSSTCARPEQCRQQAAPPHLLLHAGPTKAVGICSLHTALPSPALP
jgi:hypothetical protein